MKSWANIYIIGISILSAGVDIACDFLFSGKGMFVAVSLNHIYLKKSPAEYRDFFKNL